MNETLRLIKNDPRLALIVILTIIRIALFLWSYWMINVQHI